MRHYRVRFYNLNSLAYTPSELNFEAGWLVTRIYIARVLYALYSTYKGNFNIVAKKSSSYDVVFYCKKTGQDLVGVIIDADESIAEANCAT